MADSSNLVLAKNPEGSERYVPEHWLGELSPFPGRWTAVKQDKPKAQPEATPSVAGDNAPEDTTKSPKGE